MWRGRVQKAAGRSAAEVFIIVIVVVIVIVIVIVTRKFIVGNRRESIIIFIITIRELVVIKQTMALAGLQSSWMNPAGVIALTLAFDRVPLDAAFLVTDQKFLLPSLALLTKEAVRKSTATVLVQTKMQASWIRPPRCASLSPFFI